MQPEKPLLDKTEAELKENLKDIVQNAGCALRNEAETATNDIICAFTNYVKKLDLSSICNSELKISPQADTLFRLFEKHSISFKFIVMKFTQKVSAGKISAFGELDVTLQKLVLIEITNYLKKGIKILSVCLKISKWVFWCAIAVIAFYFIYRICRSEKPYKEASKLILIAGSRIPVALLCSSLCGYIGSCCGPIGTAIGSIVGGIIGGIIGKYCGKGLACSIFPESVGGPGQPPIDGAECATDQPHIAGTEVVFGPPALGCELVQFESSSIGADIAYGVPKLW